MKTKRSQSPDQKSIWPIFIVLQLIGAIAAQAKVTERVVSPVIQILNLSNDSVKIQQLLDLGYSYEFSNPDSALIVYQIVGEIAKKNTNYLAYGKSLNYSGIVHFEKGNYTESEKLYLQSNAIFEQINYQRGIAGNFNNLGNIYLYQNKLDECIKYYLKSVRVFEDIKDTLAMINAYNNIGSILHNNEQYKVSLDYLKQAEKLSLATPDSNFITDTYLNIANSYFKSTDTVHGDLYINKAMQLADSTEDAYITMLVYNSYSDLLMRKGNKAEALEYANLSYSLAKQTGNPHDICGALIQLGEKSFVNNQQIGAETYLKEAIVLASEHNLTAMLALAHQNLTKLYEQQNHFEKAFQELKKVVEFKEVSNKKERQHIIHELETKYQTQKKEQLIAEKEQKIANQRRTIIWVFITVSGIIISFVLALAFIQQRRKALAIQVTSLEKEKELVQLKFLMEGEEKERLRLARELHDGVNGSLGAIKLFASSELKQRDATNSNLLKINTMLDEVSNEVREISHNLMPDTLLKQGLNEAIANYVNKINHAEKISIEFLTYGNVDELEVTTKLAIYRMSQELLKNIVKHAAATEGLLQLNRHNKELSLVVEDNGKGFDVFEKAKQKDWGIGLQNIYNRVEMLGGVIDIQSSLNNGTSITVNIPVN